MFACNNVGFLAKPSPINFTVSVENTDGGTVTASKSTVELGESVSNVRIKKQAFYLFCSLVNTFA